MPNIQIPDKKELKSIINENGFFLNFHVNKLDRNSVVERLSVEKNDNAVILVGKNDLPDGENIDFFSGKITTGDKNRNGYIIDTDAWDWSNYKLNPQVLYQHNDDKPIGKPVRLVKNGDSWDADFFIDYNTLEEKEAYRIKNGYVNALSTGHIATEIAFRHEETGKEITEREYIDMWFENDPEFENYTLVVKKCDGVEFSMVTIPSNVKAMTVRNAVNKLFLNIKNNVMSLKQNSTAENAEETATNEVAETTETEETVEETQDNQNSEAKAENAEAESSEAENAEVEETETSEDTEAKADDAIVSVVSNLANVVENLQKQVNTITDFISKVRKEPNTNKVLQINSQLGGETSKKMDAISSQVDAIKQHQNSTKLRLPLR